MRVELQQNIWNGRNKTEIVLPDSWKTDILNIPADDMPVITKEQIREVLEHPIAMPPLSVQAQGKHKVCIVFDDATRPTPCGLIAEVILEILFSSGVKKEEIFFLCGSGSHGVHNRKQFVDKLGEDIVSNYLILNHDCHEKCTSVGVAKEGFEIRMNNEYLDSDLRIGIGCLMPHSMCGFSGGYRGIVPGICDLDTTEHIHTLVNAEAAKVKNRRLLSGHKENMYMHEMIAEMGRLSGSFFKVDCIVNSRLELVGIFAGEALEEYKEAAKTAETMLQIKTSGKQYDVVICNANAKMRYASMGISPAFPLLKKGSIVVLVNFAYEGQIPHYLRGYWGSQCAPRIPASANNTNGMLTIVYYSPYADVNTAYALHFENSKDFITAKTWDEVMKLLPDRDDVSACVLTESTLCALI